MAAVASPTPVALSSSYADHVYRRPSRPNLLHTTRRPYVSRSSPQIPTARATNSTRTSGVDSSDDEDLAPIKLSAEAQAILDDNSQVRSSASKQHVRSDEEYEARGVQVEAELPKRLQRISLSPDRDKGSPAPRVVKIASTARPTALTTLARDGSFMYRTFDKTVEPPNRVPESRTPATHLRTVRVSGSRSLTRSPPSNLSAGKSSSGSNGSDKSTENRHAGSPEVEETKSSPEDDLVHVGPSTVMRPRRGDEHGAHSTMRIKRIGTGTFLNGPVRRGMIRRQSEEDEIPMSQSSDRDSYSPEMQVGRWAKEPELADNPELLVLHDSSPYERQETKPESAALSQPVPSLYLVQGSSPLPRPTSGGRVSPLQPIADAPKPTPATNPGSISKKSTSSRRKPTFNIPSLPPLPSHHDQENEPPPTFRREKPSISLLGELQRVQPPAMDNVSRAPVPFQASPQRQPLAPRSQNTPHRPAPAPPPKMSMLEAATSAAGSSRHRKSVDVTVNGKRYRRLDRIGRGGSSQVYRIMADNFKIFALKRVNLEDADMATIAGYKGEIELLKKLENVDRVIRLFDYDVNEDRGHLNVMMELGESDFNKMLNEQLKTENAKLDISFTRYYWKEMLQCVQAVHDHGIVHSDLKPANFLLVKGQLKLIDFGIANAIQDNTVNVHRENQIGTPNYMSPESLVSQTTTFGAGGGKVLKLGKPSDVWSLGCILYQMTYGQPPFAHITKPFERVMSIPNPKIEIRFPTSGIGGATVPFGLIKTLRRCLQREQSLRPTIAELLSEQDPFLNPVAISPDMLGRMISNVVSYCRKREDTLRASGEIMGSSCIPSDLDMKAWPWAFYEKLRQAQEEGTAW